MSQRALDLLNEARNRALENQVRCSYCDKVCDNADHLYLHITIQHPDSLRKVESKQLNIHKLNMGRENYLETLDLLGSGIAVFIEGALHIQPLPRYRRRTTNGRHEK